MCVGQQPSWGAATAGAVVSSGYSPGTWPSFCPRTFTYSGFRNVKAANRVSSDDSPVFGHLELTGCGVGIITAARATAGRVEVLTAASVKIHSGRDSRKLKGQTGLFKKTNKKKTARVESWSVRLVEFQMGSAVQDFNLRMNKLTKQNINKRG